MARFTSILRKPRICKKNGDLLGGANGRIYRALADEDGKAVALKIYACHPQVDFDSALRKAKWDHPNLTAVLDSGWGEKEGGEWCAAVVMELAAGKRLDLWLEERAWPDDSARQEEELDCRLNLLVQIAAALRHLHCQYLGFGDLDTKRVLLNSNPLQVMVVGALVRSESQHRIADNQWLQSLVSQLIPARQAFAADANAATLADQLSTELANRCEKRWQQEMGTATFLDWQPEKDAAAWPARVQMICQGAKLGRPLATTRIQIIGAPTYPERVCLGWQLPPGPNLTEGVSAAQLLPVARALVQAIGACSEQGLSCALPSADKVFITATEVIIAPDLWLKPGKAMLNAQALASWLKDNQRELEQWQMEILAYDHGSAAIGQLPELLECGHKLPQLRQDWQQGDEDQALAAAKELLALAARPLSLLRQTAREILEKAGTLVLNTGNSRPNGVVARLEYNLWLTRPRARQQQLDELSGRMTALAAVLAQPAPEIGEDTLPAIAMRMAPIWHGWQQVLTEGDNQYRQDWQRSWDKLERLFPELQGKQANWPQAMIALAWAPKLPAPALPVSFDLESIVTDASASAEQTSVAPTEAETPAEPAPPSDPAPSATTEPEEPASLEPDVAPKGLSRRWPKWLRGSVGK